MNRAGVTPKSLMQKWQFGIEIAGFDAMLFEKSDFPELDFDEVKFAPAGSIFDQKAAGRAVFKDIKVSKAVSQDGFCDLLCVLSDFLFISAKTFVTFDDDLIDRKIFNAFETFDFAWFVSGWSVGHRK